MSLDSLFPEPKVVKFGDSEITVREFVAHEFPAVVRLAASMTEASQEQVVQMVEQHADSVLKLLSSVTCEPLERLSKMRMSAILVLVEAVIEENLPFFVDSLPTAISRVGAKVRMTGSTQSNS